MNQTRLLLLLAGLPAFAASTTATFHKDVEPILQKRCQGCHRPGDIAPMSLLSYTEARPWAKAIRDAVIQKKMPPWFADAKVGHFLNDRSLTQAEINTLASWADNGAPEGDAKDAPQPLTFTEGWRIGKPDVILEIPETFNIPAKGTVPYQYTTVPTGFTEDKWVAAVEVRPSNRSVVHHIVAQTVEPGAALGKAIPAGKFTAFDLEAGRRAQIQSGNEPDMFSSSTDGEMLEVFVPGGVPRILEPGQARLIKAGSSIMFQLHYTPNGKPEQDRTRIGLIFAKQPPAQRVKGILVFNTHFTIPAGAQHQQIRARAEVTQDLKLLSLLPHMHLRGQDFEYRAIYPDGRTEVLLSVPHYDFHWQINYYLDSPKLLPKGTIIECVGNYDNSANNKYNPDATSDVHYGEQTWEEMLNGFMEVVIEPIRETPVLLGPAPGVQSP